MYTHLDFKKKQTNKQTNKQTKQHKTTQIRTKQKSKTKQKQTYEKPVDTQKNQTMFYLQSCFISIKKEG